MAWSNSACLIVLFLEKSIADAHPDNADAWTEHEDAPIPDELRLATAEDLAGKLAAYANETSSLGEDSVWAATDGFWNSMGVDTMALTSDLSQKVNRVAMLAQQLFITERNKRDKAELPVLTLRCVEWARERGLKKITLSDVEVFMLGANTQLGSHARRTLYATVNVELKTRTRL